MYSDTLIKCSANLTNIATDFSIFVILNIGVKIKPSLRDTMTHLNLGFIVDMNDDESRKKSLVNSTKIINNNNVNPSSSLNKILINS
jgi:hypothetical protein